MTRLLDQPIATIAERYRDGSLRVADVVEEAIERHDGDGSALDAYRDWNPQHARAQAKVADSYRDVGAPLRPLFGLPISIKDLYGVHGFRTYAGSAKPLPEKWETEGPIVSRLREQVGIVMGKTHTVEFAFGGIGTNPHHPVPRNPWDATAHRVPGGSSAGAGVSLCEGSAMIALGSDTGGSVRIPASVTGNVGLKTGAGRWPLTGIVPLSPTLDTPGPLTRSVADAAYAFAAFDPKWGDTAAFDAWLPRLEVADLHIGYGDPFYWENCSPGIAEGVEAAIGELKNGGARFSDHAMPETAEAYDLFRQGIRIAPDLYAFLSTELSDHMETLDPNVGTRMGPAGEVTAADFSNCVTRLNALGAAVAARMRDVDIFITPTIPITPPTVEEVATGEGYRKHNFMILRNTGMVNYLNLCAITMPVALDHAGMPVGLHLVARLGQEERLLAVALACERHLGTGAERIGRPPIGPTPA
ncbi:MAG: amidase [Alphaproteobacteria bacterium]|nr:amidase [Alphaproteobacteria bacterium]